MMPLVVTFYTNELYSHLASRLAQSCAEYGFEIDVSERPDLGSWVLNCGQKPLHILTRLELHDRDLLWVDADAQFVSEAWGLDLDCDLGFFLSPGDRYMSGTLLVRNTKPMRAMLEEWVEQQNQFPDVHDEDGMRAVIKRGHNLKTAQLDPGYLYVFDVWEKLFPRCKPIIMHKQASRLYLNPRAVQRFRPTRGIRTDIHPEVRSLNELCS